MPPSLGPQRLLLLIAYLGFISLGLPDTLIGVAWPSVRGGFGLPQDAVALVFFGTGCSYFLSSFFTGVLLRGLGIGTLLAVSSALLALSGFGYALAPVWLLFAASSLLHGLGSGASAPFWRCGWATRGRPPHGVPGDGDGEGRSVGMALVLYLLHEALLSGSGKNEGGIYP